MYLSLNSEENDQRKIMEDNTGNQLLTYNFEHIETHYDPIYRALWCTLKSTLSPTFTLSLLMNIRTIQNKIAEHCYENKNGVVKYIIWQSDNSNIFNLGLDLPYVYKLITEKNEKRLDNYLQLCIDVFYINLMKLDISPLITISLIRGKAYGGGFEAALSSDIIVAERNARCSFPEIRYNILPSLCTLNMLLRRFAPSAIESLLFQGKSINADDLLQLQLIDKITDSGSGKIFLQEKIKQIHSRHSAVADLYMAKTLATKVTYDELDKFKQMWINTALRLNSDSIKRLGRLAGAQERFTDKLRKSSNK